MSAFKQFLAKDVKLVPFTVNKQFDFDNSTYNTSSADYDTYKHDVGIDRYIGKNLSGSLFETATDATTGEVTTQYQRQIYSSVKELYYSNFISSSKGDASSANIREEISGSVDTPSYYNYLSSTLTPSRYFPTASDSIIGVISIPSKLFGEYIQPKSFIYKLEGTGSITDDGEGNLFSGSFQVGNIIYEHGIAILTSASGDFTPDQAVINTNTTCSFKSSFKIYENQYKCTLRESEFNFSLNPSISSGSTAYSSSIGTFYTPSEFLYDFATGSYFSPYISSIGLYDDNQNLLAVAKLSQPLQSSKTTDTTILVNLDL